MLGLVLAAVLSSQCTELCSPLAIMHYADLLERGGYGRLATEQAGFLIRERDGTLTTQPWRDSGHRRVHYRGSIPPNTIAIVHTHPKDSPFPSTHDRLEATRVDLPVLVVTPAGVAAAFPDGRLEQIVDASRF